MQIHDHKPVIAMQGCHQIREIVIADAAAELAIELVHCLGRQGMVVNRLNRGSDQIGEEEISFPVAQIVLKFFIRPVARASTGAELAGAEIFALFLDDLGGTSDEAVMIVTPWKSGRVGEALRLSQDANR